MERSKIMILKSNRDKILTFLIYLILLGYCKFFYIIPLQHTIFTNIPANILLSSSIAVFSFIVLWIIEKQIFLGNFSKEICLLFLILFINSIYMLAAYHYDIKKVLWADAIFLVLLGYFPFVTYIKNNSLKSLILIIESITIILSIILLLQFFIFQFTHILFLNINVFSISGNRFRGPGDGLLRVSILLSAYKVIEEKTLDLKSISNFLLGMGVVIIMDQSRMYLLSLIISVTVMLFVSYGRNILKNKSVMVVVFGIISLIIVGYLFVSLKNTLSNAHDGSNYARQGALIYYLHALSNPWWRWLTGLGIVEPKPFELAFRIIHGPRGIYYYSDIGIIGTLASLGIFGVIWTFWVGVKGFVIASYSKNFRPLYYGLMVEMTFSWLTSMSYFNDIRLITLTLVLSIIGFKSREKKVWKLPI